MQSAVLPSQGQVSGHSSTVTSLPAHARLGTCAQVAPHDAEGGANPHSNAVRRLSPRQSQCCELAASGWANKEIALRLGLSEATVKLHVKHALRTLNIPNRTSLLTIFGVMCEVPRGPVTLTIGQEQLLAALAIGLTNREISRHLDILESAVKSRIRELTRKVRVKNRTLLAAWWLARNGRPGVMNDKHL